VKTEGRRQSTIPIIAVELRSTWGSVVGPERPPLGVIDGGQNVGECISD
jgi:hypothetical protein